MSKKILVIASSPRVNGNSDILCDQFIKGANESQHAVTVVYLRNKNIAYCTGCGYCFSHHTCSQSDDMAEILQLMIETDVLVLATPVYFYTMNAQLKTLIDRTTPRYRDISNKDIYLIATMADSAKVDMDKTFESIRGFTELLPNYVEKGVVYGVDAWNKGDITNTPAYHQAYKMGKDA